MEMKTYIEAGTKKAGSNKELARILGQKDSVLSDVKAGKKGLPVEICILLADYIGENQMHVVAASNLVTEKDEKKRRILESCFRRVASIAVIVLFIGSISMASPITYANNFNIETKQFALC